MSNFAETFHFFGSMASRGVRRFGLRSRTEPHESNASHEHDPECCPILFFGFARSGTTTGQKVVAEMLGYNYCFEPVGWRFRDWPEAWHRKVQMLFRSYPDPERQLVEEFAGGPFAVPAALSDERLRTKLQGVLTELFQAVIASFGNNVVIKELRLLGALPECVGILRELSGKEPLAVYLKADPWATLYTFYRLGTPVMRDFARTLDDTCSYRRLWCDALGLANDSLPEVRNPSESLLAAVLLEWQIADRFENRGLISVLRFGDDFTEQVERWSDRSGLCLKGPSAIKVRSTDRYRKDPFFLRFVERYVGSEWKNRFEAAGFPLADPDPAATVRMRLTALANRLSQAVFQVSSPRSTVS